MAGKKALLDSKVGASMQMARGLPCDSQLPGKLYFKLFYGVWDDLLAWLNLGNIGERNAECREPWHWATCRTHGLVDDATRANPV